MVDGHRPEESDLPKVVRPGTKKNKMKLAAKVFEIFSGSQQDLGRISKLAKAKVAAITEQATFSLCTVIVVYSQLAIRTMPTTYIAFILAFSALRVILSQGHIMVALKLIIFSFEIYCLLIGIVVRSFNLPVQFRIGRPPFSIPLKVSFTIAPIVRLANTGFRAIALMFHFIHLRLKLSMAVKTDSCLHGDYSNRIFLACQGVS